MKYLKIVVSVAVFSLFVFSMWLDLVFGIYTTWSFQLSMTGIVTLLLIWLTYKMKYKMKWSIILMGLFIMMSIRYWDYNSLKPFLRSFDKLKKGMTKEEVINQMSNYKLAGQGKGFIFLAEKEADPLLDDKVEYLNYTHTEEAWGDSDWGFVYFIDNKLYRTGFSHD